MLSVWRDESCGTFVELEGTEEVDFMGHGGTLAAMAEFGICFRVEIVT